MTNAFGVTLVFMSISTVKRYFAALHAGDMEIVASLFDPQVLWHQPGDNQFSGVHRGIDAVGTMITEMMELTHGTFTVVVTGSLMLNGNEVAVPVRFSAQREGATLDMAGIDVLTINGGKISQVRLFSEDSAAEDRFWG